MIFDVCRYLEHSRLIASVLVKTNCKVEFLNMQRHGAEDSVNVRFTRAEAKDFTCLSLRPRTSTRTTSLKTSILGKIFHNVEHWYHNFDIFPNKR